MEMINRCLEISAVKRAEIEDADRRNEERKALIAERIEHRSPDFGNRKQRRRAAALARRPKREIA